MELSRNFTKTPGLLYPLMVIAAIAVIVFSIVGIASIAGWMPHAMLGGGTAVAQTMRAATTTRGVTEIPQIAPASPAFQCVECGVVESVREIERGGSLWAVPVATVTESALPTATRL